MFKIKLAGKGEIRAREGSPDPIEDPHVGTLWVRDTGDYWAEEFRSPPISSLALYTFLMWSGGHGYQCVIVSDGSDKIMLTRHPHLEYVLHKPMEVSEHPWLVRDVR